VTPIQGPPPMPESAESDDDEDDDDFDEDGDNAAMMGKDAWKRSSFNEDHGLTHDMIGRKMSFLKRAGSIAMDNKTRLKHLVMTITETEESSPGMVDASWFLSDKPLADTDNKNEQEDEDEDDKEEEEENEEVDGQQRHGFIDWSFMRRKRPSVSIKKKKKEKRLHKYLRQVSLSKPRSSASIERLRRISRGDELDPSTAESEYEPRDEKPEEGGEEAEEARLPPGVTSWRSDSASRRGPSSNRHTSTRSGEGLPPRTRPVASTPVATVPSDDEEDEDGYAQEAQEYLYESNTNVRRTPLLSPLRTKSKTTKSTKNITSRHTKKFQVELAEKQREALRAIEMKKIQEEEKRELEMQELKAQRAAAAEKRMKDREKKLGAFRSPKKAASGEGWLPDELNKKRMEERESKLYKFASPKELPSGDPSDDADERGGAIEAHDEESTLQKQQSISREVLQRKAERLPENATYCALRLQSSSTHKLVLDVKGASTSRGAPLCLSAQTVASGGESANSSRSRSPKKAASPPSRVLVANQMFLLDAKSGVVAPHYLAKQAPGKIRKTHQFIVTVRDGVPEKEDAAVVTWTPLQGSSGQELKGGFEAGNKLKIGRSYSEISVHQQWVLTEEGFLASKLPPGGIATNSTKRVAKPDASTSSATPPEVAGDINAFVLGMPSTYTRIFPSDGVELVLVSRKSPRALRWEVALPDSAESRSAHGSAAAQIATQGGGGTFI
jgi:hypothetical protein